MKGLFAFILSVFFAETHSMSMYAFDVGAGNFVLFRHENRAFIVDCGTYRSDISSYVTNSEFRKNVGAVLDGVDCVKIAVTHAHVDHYDLIKGLFLEASPICPMEKINGVLVCAASPIIALQSLDINGSSVTFVTNTSGDDNEEIITGFLSDALFEVSDEYNHIRPLLVSELFGEIKGDSDPHDVNLMLKVVCGSEEGKQAVLLPGDASISLISAVRELHPDIYEDVECVLWPHHGSCDSGQQALVAFSPERKIRLISGFPKATWFLPREEVLLYCSPASSEYTFIREHEIYYADGSRKLCSKQIAGSVFMTSALRKTGDVVGTDGVVCDFYNGWLTLSYLTLGYPVYCSICEDTINAGEQSIQSTLQNMRYSLFAKLIVNVLSGNEHSFQGMRDVLLYFSGGYKYPIEFVEGVLGVQYEDPDSQWYFELFSSLGLCDLPDVRDPDL